MTACHDPVIFRYVCQTLHDLPPGSKVIAPNLGAGNLVVVTDVTTGVTKELVVAFLTIDTIDPANDTVSARRRGNRGHQILVELVDPGGAWTADFRATDVDITPQSQVIAGVGDADGDQ